MSVRELLTTAIEKIQEALALILEDDARRRDNALQPPVVVPASELPVATLDACIACLEAATLALDAGDVKAAALVVGKALRYLKAAHPGNWS